MNGGAAAAGGGAMEPTQGNGVLKKAESGDWLADIFDAMEEGAITSLEISDMALPDDAIAALEAEVKAEGRLASEAGDDNDGEEAGGGGKRGRGEGGEDNGAKGKKSKREKLRREALNDR
jgi:hypothetical protein